jgi:hypothetical protein
MILATKDHSMSNVQNTLETKSCTTLACEVDQVQSKQRKALVEKIVKFLEKEVYNYKRKLDSGIIPADALFEAQYEGGLSNKEAAEAIAKDVAKKTGLTVQAAESAQKADTYLLFISH